MRPVTLSSLDLRSSILVLAFSASLCLCASADAGVPPWDARGVGPVPWQRIACIDISDDGRWLALGTIAPAGDPNVFLLDADGKLVRTATVGQRWIQQVAVDGTGKMLHALCTMPDGKASDFPTVYRCDKQSVAFPSNLGEPGWPQNLFQYGPHSNHTGVILRSLPQGAVGVYGNRVLWFSAREGNPETEVEFPRPDNGVTVSMIAGSGGHVLVGCTARAGASDKPKPNLFLLSPKDRKPLWARPVLVDTDRGTPPEKGVYGKPTLPDGSQKELPQKDLPVFAPLSLALQGRDAPGGSPWPIIPAGNAGFAPRRHCASRTTARASNRPGPP